MEVTQSYARPSAATIDNDGMRLNVSAEQSRPPVFLEALIKDSLAYARLMLALHAVVSGDFRNTPKDHTAYQEWVMQRYLEELTGEMASRLRTVPGLTQRRAELSDRIATLNREARQLETTIGGGDFYKCKRRYFAWLLEHDREAWYVLDPVVSVHPDCLIFEVFSLDESSYGRVTVPSDRLETFGTTVYGTTNIDFSRALADEIQRVRSYRPAWLRVGSEGVSLATSAGERVEKKIDLPPSWVRGFLQVQSASAFATIDLKLSAATVAEVLCALRRQKENQGPRSLRFVLAPGEKPTIVIEPWNIAIKEAEHLYTGSHQGDVRIWGRRRLFVLESLLPHAEAVQVRLLGSGMPSYWTVFQKSHRFDLGLSGWTKNDWAQAARFDLLASTAEASIGDIATTVMALEKSLRLTPEEAAQQTGLSRDATTAALQRLCADGRAMFDHVTGAYRWRPLLPFPVKFEGDEDKRLAAARRLLAANAVKFRGAGEKDEEETSLKATGENTTRLRAFVKGEKQFRVTLDVDRDGRVQFAECTCSWHRREKLRKGPCAHILAVSALASKQVAIQAAQATSSSGPNPFKDKTFVFTGALTLFTRDQAEAMVKQRGGSAAGSVSKNTDYLVAGDKAGSKLAKAQQLGIPILTEQQFQDMLDG